MAYVIRFGSTYRIFSEDDISVTEKLPAKTYTVKKNEMSGEFYLEPIDSFVMPPKFYGDTEPKASRILKTFMDRKGSMGVHMDGVKGSGKTLLAKRVSDLALAMDIPTIVINNSYCGDEFNKFVQSINVPAIMLFDEFEKVYDYNTQDKILTLFDGVYPSKKLFMITTNKSHMVNDYLKNRPGRIYYSFKFDTLEQNFVKEYCEDNLNDKAQIDSIVKYTNVFSFFNFDMLAAAVEEMNRYGESLQEVLEYLNIVPENKSSDTYTITAKFLDWNFVAETSFRGFDANRFEYYIIMGDDDVAKTFDNPDTKKMLENFTDGEGDLFFKSDYIESFDPNTHTFTYAQEKNGNRLELSVTRNANTAIDAYKHLF
jgi:hypothetical protein